MDWWIIYLPEFGSVSLFGKRQNVTGGEQDTRRPGFLQFVQGIFRGLRVEMKGVNMH